MCNYFGIDHEVMMQGRVVAPHKFTSVKVVGDDRYRARYIVSFAHYIGHRLCPRFGLVFSTCTVTLLTDLNQYLQCIDLITVINIEGVNERNKIKIYIDILEMNYLKTYRHYMMTGKENDHLGPCLFIQLNLLYILVDRKYFLHLTCRTFRMFYSIHTRG